MKEAWAMPSSYRERRRGPAKETGTEVTGGESSYQTMCGINGAMCDSGKLKTPRLRIHNGL
jgi:hypothetical protein